ncbi:unnamed protein product [Linum trigynum]|uniref:Uncharacterized protein n=1 Tax=Linum trigynum TaxID=586398 RepID=A0AAV2DB60_9ROSI
MSSTDISELTWAQKQERLWKIVEYWKSYALRREKADAKDGGNDATERQQPPTGVGGPDEQPSPISSAADDGVEKSNKNEKQLLLAITATPIHDGSSAAATITAAAPPTPLVASEQSSRVRNHSKFEKALCVVVTKEEGDLSSSVLVPDKESLIVHGEESQTEGSERRSVLNQVANWIFRKKEPDGKSPSPTCDRRREVMTTSRR